jgi:hypothetical protein
VFRVPDAKPSERASVRLGGVWEIARDDEQLPGAVAAPIHCPALGIRFGAPSPCPATRARFGRTSFLPIASGIARASPCPPRWPAAPSTWTFPCNNLNTTVYVNGVYCGFEKNPFAPFQVDVTQGIKAGQTNEIQAGIRDAWYGRSADPARPLKLRKTFNYPVSLFGQGFQDMDYPVWNCPQSGILATPAFVAAGGGVYAADVFVKPSVAQKRLEAELSS